MGECGEEVEFGQRFHGTPYTTYSCIRHFSLTISPPTHPAPSKLYHPFLMSRCQAPLFPTPTTQSATQKASRDPRGNLRKGAYPDGPICRIPSASQPHAPRCMVHATKRGNPLGGAIRVFFSFLPSPLDSSFLLFLVSFSRECKLDCEDVSVPNKFVHGKV